MTTKTHQTHHPKTHTHETTDDETQAAFEQTAGARAALRPEDLVTINVDAQVAFTTVIGALPAVQTLRESVAKLPEFDLEQFDLLKKYAMALDYANTVFLAASEPVEALPALGERATQIRATLLSDATALAKRGFFDPNTLAELKGGPGYLNIGSDVAVLTRMFREKWDQIAGKTAVQPAELDEAVKIANRVKFAFAERTQQPQHVLAAADDKHRAYTLLVNAYDQARRAATYIRWTQGDADKLVPSLWAGRGGRGNTSANAPATPTTPATPATPPVVVAAPSPAPTNGAPAQPVEAGHPGGSPFVS